MSKIAFNWQDPFLLSEQLSPSEQEITQKTAEFAQKKLMPRVLEAFRSESFPREVIREMGVAGLLGANLKDYGCAGVSEIAYGMIAHEIEKVDSGFRSAWSIQSGLVMHAIHAFGSEQQKKTWLPKLGKGEAIGSFCLTEPNHGSDPAGMETRVIIKDNQSFLTGHKKWIGLTPFADIFIVWAKNPEGKIQGYLLEKNMKGVTTNPLLHKLSLRAASVGEVRFDHVTIHDENILPAAKGLSAAFSCLNNARYGIAWGALGAAYFCWQYARDYVMERWQFSRPLAANQLIQFKLANMQTQINTALQACYRVGQLKSENKAAPELISLIKRNSALVALDVARNARDMLGANGIADEHHVMRHLVNLETVNTYEGTQDIHALILGKSQTDIAAFS